MSTDTDLKTAAEDWRDEAIAALELAGEIALGYGDHGTAADCERLLAQFRDTPADRSPARDEPEPL